MRQSPPERTSTEVDIAAWTPASGPRGAVQGVAGRRDDDVVADPVGLEQLHPVGAARVDRGEDLLACPPAISAPWRSSPRMVTNDASVAVGLPEGVAVTGVPGLLQAGQDLAGDLSRAQVVLTMLSLSDCSVD